MNESTKNVYSPLLATLFVDLSFSAGGITTLGGSRFAYKRVTEAGADLTTPDTWHDGVYRSKSKFGFRQPQNPIKDEAGETVQIEKEAFEMDLMITSLQDDANVFQFLRDEVEDTYFAIFMDRGKLPNGKRQELFIAICRIERTYESEAPGRNPEIKITALANKSAVTPATVPSWAVGDAGDFATAVDKYAEMADTTPA